MCVYMYLLSLSLCVIFCVYFCVWPFVFSSVFYRMQSFEYFYFQVYSFCNSILLESSSQALSSCCTTITTVVSPVLVFDDHSFVFLLVDGELAVADGRCVGNARGAVAAGSGPRASSPA